MHFKEMVSWFKTLDFFNAKFEIQIHESQGSLVTYLPPHFIYLTR
jgi:hypothetical protein